GVQPKDAHGRMRPGFCRGKVHQRATLGIGGRRVLVSRNWSGKTLADHRADTRAWVRALLGISDGHDQAAAVDHQSGTPAPVAWEMARPDDPDVPPLQHRLLRAVSARIQRRAAIAAARERAGPDPPTGEERGRGDHSGR
ncbi:MAG TPA: replication initiator, partial [Micromonosporaceae bacterium]|nr:replication initiator [Micromonosporaceae bacterium]